jgi:hypothetical protein
MRLRAHRRGLVVWSSTASPVVTGRSRRVSARRGRRVSGARRTVRTGTTLTILGLLWLARVIRPRWQPLLTGVACTIAGTFLRSGSWGAILLPGLLLLAYSLFVPAAPNKDRRRLADELGAYSTRAQRHDLEATLDQYPDSVTTELREILARKPYAHG